MKGLRATLPRDRWGCLAVVVFLALSIPLALIARDERSGMIQMTRPTHEYTSSNLSIGFTDFVRDRPLFRENRPFVRMVEVFNGLEATATFYFARPFYSFLAAQAAPFTGVLPALFLVNYAAWAICAFVTWRFTLALFRDRLAAAIAVVLLTGGMGMLAHVGDYSAHLLSFCMSYVGMLVLLESGVWREARPLRTHLLIGLFLAVAFLTYNSGLMLLAAYLAVAIRGNRAWHLAAAAAVTLSGQRVWHAALSASGLIYPDVEQVYLSHALTAWHASLALPASQMAGRILAIFAEFLAFDSPGVVAAGLIGLLALFRSLPLVWLCAVLIAAPLGAGLILAPAAGARGYIVYQISLIFYCAASRLFSLGLRSGLALRSATAAVLALVVAGHFAWSTAHLYGENAPITAYFLGIDDAWPLFQHDSPRSISLTGAEPTPTLFGGNATLAEAGLYAEPRTQEVPSNQISWRRAAGLRLPILLYLGAIAWLLVPRGRARWGLVLALLAVTLVLPTAATRLTTQQHLLAGSDRAFSAPPQSRLLYHVQLSAAFAESLEEALEAGDQVAFQFRLARHSMAPRLRVSAGATPIALRRIAETPRPPSRPFYLWLARQPELAVRELARAREVTFELVNGPHRIALSAWQRGDLVDRSASVTTRTGKPVPVQNARLPGFEIRLLRPDHTLKLAGF